MHSSGHGRAGFVGLLENALTRDATRRLQFEIHAAGWQHSMVIHGRWCSHVLGREHGHILRMADSEVEGQKRKAKKKS